MIRLDVTKYLNLNAERDAKERVRRYTRGWIGEGVYTCKHQAYRPWCNMIRRALAIYDQKMRAKQDPNCWNSIVGEWYCFQNFAAWWDEQHEFRHRPPHITLQLDKDLFGVWGRLYSPDRCALLPASINRLLRYYEPTEGLKQHPKTGKWSLSSTKYGRLVARNEFDTMDDAYFARAKLIQAEVISIASPIRHMFSERVYEQLVHGYWQALRTYMSPSVDAAAASMRKAAIDAAREYAA